MPVHYPKEIMKRARERGHKTATIAVGRDTVWQGCVSPSKQILLLQLIEEEQRIEAIERATEAAHNGDRPPTLTIPGMESEPRDPRFAHIPLPADPPKRGRKKPPGRPRKKAAAAK